ncbi:MAG: SidA/IucD/PvdA family monooxygenase, partial [Kangiellaceae bacterium]|nr:SidA/IucD/PvdA family monooxygenase [Kangiellaceae bacterium]
MQSKIYDFIAVGLGPFNLSLACLTSTAENVEAVFLEQRAEFNWHPGMMLENATLQTPFLSDLVTLADPTHPLSFLNYSKKRGLLYSFYIRENFFLMREEYNQYCQWACRQLDNIRFNTQVEAIVYDKEKSSYCVTCLDKKTGSLVKYFSKKIVLGTGPSPYWPQSVAECLNSYQQAADSICHSGDYLEKKESLQSSSSITILGSGQSAAEIYYDLLQSIDEKNYQLNWITRSPRYFPLEYSKLTLEMTSPEYVDYFYNLKPEKRDQLISSQKHLYKGINSSLINEIYDLLYIKNLKGSVNTRLTTNSELRQCLYLKNSEGLAMDFYQREQNKAFQIYSEKLVVASGYQYQLPEFLSPIMERIKWDKQGRFDVNRNYSIDQKNEIFIQNAELHTHGFVTPDLGMACYRNSVLLKEITGVEHYPIESKVAFQNFGVSEFDTSSFDSAVG